MSECQQFLVWKYMSYAWSEWGLSEDETCYFIAEFKKYEMSKRDIESVIFKECLFGFSHFIFLQLVIFIPILGMIISPTILPEVEMEDRIIRKYIGFFKTWKVIYYLNPLCWLGYIFAYVVSRDLIKNIKLNF